MDLASLRLDRALIAARSFVRPVGWRGAGPDPALLEGSLLFERPERATSFDGTKLAYGVHGDSGPWVVLVPGFGCPDNFWKYLLPPLARRFRVIVFDSRGVGMSGYPRKPGYRARDLKVGDFSIENHARDVAAVMDAAGADRAALIGHSMGGQVALETYRTFRERVTAIVMLTAPFESPTRTLYGRDLDVLLRALSAWIRMLPRPAVLLWRALFLARPELTHRGAQLARALGPLAKAEDMASYYRHLAFLDPTVLMKMADAMRAHSARDVLATVDVPTLIVAGDLDPFTPVALARTMREEIRDSELLVLEGASHGAVIEKPDDVNFAVTSFLERRLREEPPGALSSSRGTRAAPGSPHRPARVAQRRRVPRPSRPA
jgi:pimeloyl-ACP methyl ester carboxylesterase